MRDAKILSVSKIYQFLLVQKAQQFIEIPFKGQETISNGIPLQLFEDS